ncbi:hypothetical protein MCOR25_003538 [Pyricularia grisea]|uniref:C2H2-type domain-containing protein n=1 Tax=Pyricularia grisea TaxID=148305 RepID=A0A6P8AXV5_PYRGI|nr:hypothetical protein PgNI_10331 [Pyricularia grisea]KAI6373140.1 hypothetical protein MCOR25_003538 [Pyricularia grisea]TLD07116.1 hypothetical protein PgNI_10331 [Pyricularia grisea]
MAATMIQQPYPIHQQQSQYSYMAQPQGPPSPPMDDNKCSLPSISNLLGLADQGSPTSETSAQFREEQKQQQAAQQSRPSSSHYNNAIQSVRQGIPPTPPMTSETSFDGYNSPSNKSVSQLPATGYYFEATPPPGHMEMEPRPHMTSVSRVPVQAPFAQSAYSAPYGMAPSNPMAAYYPTMQPTPPPQQPQISSLYYQRPLPQAFPPMPVNVSMGPQSGANPWQHHHYISPSAAASFPQSQDRYICQTCNKAFSRPSSLRIHSHSHTGEKPFKCPHAGCGKAFSVRSNMKRHERGCHNYDSSSSNSTTMH